MDELRRRAQAVLDSPPVPRTPIDALVSRAGRRRTRRVYGSAVALVGCIAVAVAVAVVADARTTPSPRITVVPTSAVPTSVVPSTTTPGVASTRVGAPDSFVSTRVSNVGASTIAVSDARTGKVRKTLYTVPSDGSVISGTAIAPNGDVWITIDRGPKMLGHVAGGNPQAHTCSSVVLAIDPDTGRTRTVLRGGDDELIEDAQPNPADGRVAYLHSGCADSYFNNALQVKDLASGTVVSIGSGLPACHVLANPRWTADGRNIAFVYGGNSGPVFKGGLGTCSVPLAAQATVVSAERSQSGLDGSTVAPDTGCEVNAIAVTKTGYVGIQHCGVLYISGPVQLVRYSRALHVVSRTPLGQCENGASVGGDARTDTVVISAYEFCGGTAAEPVTDLFTDTGATLHQVTSIPGGDTAVGGISF